MKKIAAIAIIIAALCSSCAERTDDIYIKWDTDVLNGDQHAQEFLVDSVCKANANSMGLTVERAGFIRVKNTSFADGTWIVDEFRKNVKHDLDNMAIIAPATLNDNSTMRIKFSLVQEMRQNSGALVEGRTYYCAWLYYRYIY